MSGIIDHHTHGYADEVRQDPQTWAESRGEKHWWELVRPRPSGVEVQGWASQKEMLEAMDAAGIEKAVLLGWYWENQLTCEEQNEWYIRWVKDHPERFIGFATVQPRAGERAFESLKRAIDGGLSGIGELLPRLQGYDLDNATWRAILSWAEENGLPINFHVTEPVGHNYPGRIETPFSDFQQIAQTYPELKMILAHWGGGLPFYGLGKANARWLRNVYYDTAASPLLYDHKVFRHIVGMVGTEKVLFGSDYPLKLYPKRQEKPDFHSFVQDIRESLPENEANAILRNIGPLGKNRQ